MSTKKQNVVRKTSKTKKPADDVEKPKRDETKTIAAGKTGAKKTVPSSPTSSRVSKSQFFPSKQMYANALTSNEKIKIKEQLQVKTAAKEVPVKARITRSENDVSKAKAKEMTTLKARNSEQELVVARSKVKKVATTKVRSTEQELGNGVISSPRVVIRPKGKEVTTTVKNVKQELGNDVAVVKKARATKPSSIELVSSPRRVVRPKLKEVATTNVRSVEQELGNEVVSSPRVVIRSKVKEATTKAKSVEQELGSSPRIATPKTVEQKGRVKEDGNNSERPRTATLAKSSVVTSSTAGPEANKATSPDPSEGGYDYEDDFDSYASDFEEYHSSTTSEYSVSTNEGITSSSSTEDISLPKPEVKEKRLNSAEEEKKLDSGNFDLPENKHKQLLGGISENAPQMSSLSDEGFEDARSLQFVNFLGAKKRRDRERDLKKRSKRGEQLMKMIKLDSRNYTLFDMPPVSYENYIRSFGNKNSVQISLQTGEDDVAEETQTDLIEGANKWTQFPVKFTKVNKEDDNYMGLYRSELLGVGSDDGKDESLDARYNEYRLGKFMESAGNVVLAILQRNNQSHAKEIEVDDRKLPFSDGYVPLNTQFVHNRFVAHVSFSPTNSKLLSIHEPKQGHDDTVECKSIGCVWNLGSPAVPEEVFAAFGTISAACFAVDNNKLILGGSRDGTVTLWDLSDSRGTRDYLDIDPKSRVEVKLSTYATPVDVDYCNRIVAIRSSYEISTGESGDDWVAPVQVLSLDEVGNLIIWGLISKPSLENHEHTHHKSLVRNTVVSLQACNPDLQDLLCTGMSFNSDEPEHVYVSTNYGYTIYSRANVSKSNQKRFPPVTKTTATSLEACPHHPDYFLVGFEDGNVSLYSKSIEKPLMTMRNQEDGEVEVEVVQWSRNRPCLFYTKDSRNQVHIWDLTFSELLPAYSVPFDEDIKGICVSSVDRNDSTQTRSYLAIVTTKGSIQLHVLNKDHGYQQPENYHAELKTFSNYVNRL